MIPIWILRNFLKVKWGSLPRKWSLQSQPLDTSKQLQVIPKQLKFILWGIKKLTSHQASPSGNNIPTSKDQSQKRYSNEHKNQRPPVKTFDPSQAHNRRDRCSKCANSKHVEGFKCHARKFQCKTCNEYDHFTSLCYKKQSSFMSRNPKAHQLQVGVVHAQEASICGQSSDLTLGNESFCLHTS